MKKIIQAFIFLAFISQGAFGVDEGVCDADKKLKNNLIEKNTKNEELYEKPVILEPEERYIEEENRFKPQIKQTLKGIIEKDYDLNSTHGLFKDQLTIKFDKGIIKEHTNELAMIHNFSQIIERNDSDFNYEILPINLVTFGTFRSEKERYVVVSDLTPDNHINFFQGLILDAYIESSRIPNHTLKIGKFRPSMGYEGGLSSFLVPLSQKSQIARHFSDARKIGASISGDFKYIDYAIEGFSSDIQFQDFMPGVEGVLWVDFKPLAKFDNKYGNLKIGGGYQAGVRNSTDYNVAAAGIKYDYKKFWISSEYAHANGSNGVVGLSNAKRAGYNVTLAYRPTKKLELLMRFDDFDNDLDISNNNTKEYTLGFNYYICGQALRIICNYIYSQKDRLDDSHKIILGTQIAI